MTLLVIGISVLCSSGSSGVGIVSGDASGRNADTRRGGSGSTGSGSGGSTGSGGKKSVRSSCGGGGGSSLGSGGFSSSVRHIVVARITF